MTKTILVLAANPKDTSRLRLDQEVREIDNGLQRAKRRDEFILVQKWAPRRVDVRRAMLDLKPNIVHFCGHGEGEEGLIFEDETGNAQLVSSEALAGFFELFADIVECVVLNACYSEVQAEAIAKHIDHVVGMSKSIGDDAAIEFAVAFYDALGAGESIEFAHRLAYNAIQWTGMPEYLTPTLKQKSRSVATSSEKGKSTQNDDPSTQSQTRLLPQQPSPLPELPDRLYNRFIGRTQQLGTVITALRSSTEKSMIAIFGLGGIGKTTLAREAVEQCRRNFDYIVWKSYQLLRFIEGQIFGDQISWGFDVDTLLTDICYQCGLPVAAKLALPEKKASIRSLLTGKRVLLVLDNLETLDVDFGKTTKRSERLVDELFQLLGTNSKILVTSRHEIKYSPLFSLSLSRLDELDGLEFLQVEIETRNATSLAQASRDTLKQIYDRTGGAPLAMKLVIGQTKHLPLDAVLLYLEDATEDYYQLYGFIYHHSWNLLDDMARTALLRMSIFPPVTAIERKAVEKVSGLSQLDFYKAIDMLVTMSLVDIIGPAGKECFTLHPLTHHFILAEKTREASLS